MTKLKQYFTEDSRALNQRMNLGLLHAGRRVEKVKSLIIVSFYVKLARNITTYVEIANSETSRGQRIGRFHIGTINLFVIFKNQHTYIHKHQHK